MRMNHGVCERCWWWYHEQKVKTRGEACWGRCYRWGGNVTKNDGYCSDYLNRQKKEKKEHKTLLEWLNK